MGVGGERPLSSLFLCLCLSLSLTDYITHNIQGNVVGRKVVDVRICSCPKRDLQQEETRLHAREDQCKQIAQR